MKFRLPHAPSLALASFLPLTLPLAIHAQDWAKTRLESSPRHREYVTLHHDARAVQALVVYPEVKDKVPVVVMIHEIFGQSDWAREMADEVAAEGFIVVDAAADYGKKLPAANGKIAVAGFCWGGTKSFAFAAHRKDLRAAFVFYGSGPADVTPIVAPVYGFYAGNDARIGATVPATTEAMKAAGKVYEPITYDGAGHGFMRAGEDPTNTNPANKTARAQAFARFVKLLHAMH
jgi:carboxymethylenebutenolidase